MTPKIFKRFTTAQKPALDRLLKGCEHITNVWVNFVKTGNAPLADPDAVKLTKKSVISTPRYNEWPFVYVNENGSYNYVEQTDTASVKGFFTNAKIYSKWLDWALNCRGSPIQMNAKAHETVSDDENADTSLTSTKSSYMGKCIYG